MDAHSAKRRLMLSRHRMPMRRPSPSRQTRVAKPPPQQSVREEFAAELERAKLDAMKELAYGASHEINNPLANIALRAQTLLKRESDAEKRRALEAMHRGAMRAHEMISDLMLFARPPKPEPADTDVDALLRAVVEELATLARERSIDLRTSSDQRGLLAYVDPVQLGVAVRALVENAIEAIGSDGVVETRCALSDGTLSIEIDDDGPGIASEVRPHVFDPFFSGREAGRGLGFGLSKCWRIVTDQGGQVAIEDSPLGGVRFCLTLPCRVSA